VLIAPYIAALPPQDVAHQQGHHDTGLSRIGDVHQHEVQRRGPKPRKREGESDALPDLAEDRGAHRRDAARRVREEQRREAEEEGERIDAERECGTRQHNGQPAHGGAGDTSQAAPEEAGGIAGAEDVARNEVRDDRVVRGREEGPGAAEHRRCDVDVLET